MRKLLQDGQFCSVSAFGVVRLFADEVEALLQGVARIQRGTAVEVERGDGEGVARIGEAGEHGEDTAHFVLLREGGAELRSGDAGCIERGDHLLLVVVEPHQHAAVARTKFPAQAASFVENLSSFGDEFGNLRSHFIELVVAAFFDNIERIGMAVRQSGLIAWVQDDALFGHDAFEGAGE